LKGDRLNVNKSDIVFKNDRN